MEIRLCYVIFPNLICQKRTQFGSGTKTKCENLEINRITFVWNVENLLSLEGENWEKIVASEIRCCVLRVYNYRVYRYMESSPVNEPTKWMYQGATPQILSWRTTLANCLSRRRRIGLTNFVYLIVSQWSLWSLLFQQVIINARFIFIEATVLARREPAWHIILRISFFGQNSLMRILNCNVNHFRSMMVRLQVTS